MSKETSLLHLFILVNQNEPTLETKQINLALVFKLHCQKRSISTYEGSLRSLRIRFITSISFISSSACSSFFFFHVHPHRAKPFSSATSRILIGCSLVYVRVCVCYISSQARMECIINFSRGAVFPAASSSPTIRFAKSVFDRLG